MKAASVYVLKQELDNYSREELREFCLRLAKFKKENKELLSYLLFEATDESAFIRSVKSEIMHDFEQINNSSYYYIKKSVRKILRNIKKYIRYSKIKETEVELLLFYCSELKQLNPSIDHNTALQNLFDRQVALIRKAISTLHEDLQYDYNNELAEVLAQ